MPSAKADESIDLGENDSYTEEDSDEESLSDAVESQLDHEEDGNEALDRIGTLANDFATTLTKQQQVLKAHVSILASALGGFDYSSESEQYKLGDDALACLKDIKRWLRSVDEQDKKWDVAMACADTGLLQNDLIVILCQWEADASSKQVKNKNYMERIALAVLELLVPLTWPLLLTKESSINQINHYPNLKKAQLSYKKAILTFQDGRALRAVIRLSLPIISKSKADRTSRDNAILRLCIYFFRNVVKIEPANSTVSSRRTTKGNHIQDNLPTDVSMEDISLNAVLESYEKNKVLDFLLTVTNLLGSDLDEEMLNMGCLECFYHLTDGVCVPKMFKAHQQNAESSEAMYQPQSVPLAGLKDLLDKEKNIRKTAVKSSSSRHGRFGTLLSLQTVDNGRLTISGQKGINDKSSTLAQLDESKSWRPAKQAGQSMKFTPNTEMEGKLGKNSTERFLSFKSFKILKVFMNGFVESCFNPLSYSLRRRFLSAEHPSFNTLQYFDLITWIIEYETEKRFCDKEGESNDNGYFSSILEDDFFTLVITTMRKASEEYKQWPLVQSCMKSFKQVISFADLIGSTSSDPSDQLMSHNLKQRLFKREVTLDLLAALPRNAHKISADYVRVVVELTYVVLKTLQKFSKDDESIFVAAKRASKKKVDQHASDSEDEDAISTNVKSLNFLKYQAKFIHRDTIKTHLSLFERYQEVGEQDIKRCLSFFYRVFYTSERHLDLYRLDFMILLHQMTGNGPKSLSRSSPLKAEVIAFTKYYMKKLVENLEKAPSLFVELCFYSSANMSSRSKYFLEHGEILKENSSYVVGRELFFKVGHEIDNDRKFAIIVSFMIDNVEREYVELASSEVSRILNKRKEWAENQSSFNSLDGTDAHDADISENSYLRFIPTDENTKKALIKNSRFRLLLKTIGFLLPETSSEYCRLDPHVTMESLVASLDSLTKYMRESVKFPEGRSAGDYITKSYDGYEISDHEDGDYNGYEEEAEDEADKAFESNQMNMRTQTSLDLDKLDELENRLSQAGRHKRPLGQARRKNRGKITVESTRKKKTRANRYDKLDMHDMSDVETPDARRLPKEFEYRSSEFIQDSDDEDESEFFAKEQFLRQLLEANGGVLKPEHAKLFVDDSWKRYKLSSLGDITKRPTYENLLSLDAVVKNTGSQLTQATPSFEDSQKLVNISEDDSESSEPMSPVQDSVHAERSSPESEISDDKDSEVTDEDASVSNVYSHNSKRKFENENLEIVEDENLVVRKKARRVLYSDDDE